MTRIVAGSRGGRRIATPNGVETRPTSDRVREALFSALEARLELTGCRFADLYAGSGAVGLEAASRGASHVLLVECDQRATRVIRSNIAGLGLSGTCTLAPVRVAAALAGPPDAPYDAIFADPPYALTELELAAMIDRAAAWLVPGGILVIERSSRTPQPSWPAWVTPEPARRYGETVLWYVARDGADSGPE